MEIFDITRPLLQTPPYPGDPLPVLQAIGEARDGFCTQTLFASLHTGTHIDAPLHVRLRGDVASLPLDACMGDCALVSAFTDGQRVLLRGKQITLAQAEAFSGRLIGTDQSSIAPPDAEYAVHAALLRKGVVILENVDVSRVPDGNYTLLAIPLKLQDAEASPVRALLLK
jgi:arylformamidase